MSLKRRIARLEERIGTCDPVRDAIDFVRFTIKHEILLQDIDFEATVKYYAKEGVSLRKIVQEIHEEAHGLPKLPCEQENCWVPKGYSKTASTLHPNPPSILDRSNAQPAPKRPRTRSTPGEGGVHAVDRP